MKARLTAKRLSEAVSISCQEKQFKFIVGKEEREYACSVVEACFISGKVCRLVSSDSTINVLRVLSDEECAVFGLIEDLWSGKCIDITKDNIGCLLKLSDELENEELCSIFVDYNLSNEEISVDNCLSRLHSKTRLGLDPSEEFAFIASNFSDFEDLSSLSVADLERVLSHEELKIESENSLLDWIFGMVSRDGSYSSLLKYVQFEYLDPEHLELFFKAVYPEHVDCVLWESIVNFVTKSVKKSPPKPLDNKRLKMIGYEFRYNSSSPFNGIVSHLRSECGGNPHVKGVISIEVSSIESNACHQVVDYGWNNYIRTPNTANSWIQFDFKEKTILLESYTIKSDNNGGGHLKQWKIEGSNDASSWTELDSRDTNALNGSFRTEHFTCSKQPNCFCYIRLTQTGLNTDGSHYMRLSEIEFFGTLTVPLK